MGEITAQQFCFKIYWSLVGLFWGCRGSEGNDGSKSKIFRVFDPPTSFGLDCWPSNLNQSHLPNECEWLYQACIYSTEILLYTVVCKIV